MTAKPLRSVPLLALLALVTACNHTSPAPATNPSSQPATPAPATQSSAAAQPQGGGIPQGGGGDHDADNNGGPSDGDGNR
ncbi:MAG TPA: hypothetical protein VNE21_00735 [Mycobacteriales bacterium]|nr:hypothetical protein [Mycobacteriales bacterium]